MPVEMIGRRHPVDTGAADQYRAAFDAIKQAGDYYGPFQGSSGCAEVWFLLPIARDDGKHGEERALHHVRMPPHVFKEEPDGTLTIRESIGAGPGGVYYWHGFLNQGRWELNRKD